MNKKNAIIYFLLMIGLNSCSQIDKSKNDSLESEIGLTKNGPIDSLEFQNGYPEIRQNALEQLRSFPSPRYTPGNTFIRLFSWMNPYYLGGGGQPGVNEGIALHNAILFEEEMIRNWNYFLIIPNSNIAAIEKAYNSPNSKIKAYIDLANNYPEIPLAVTTFWEQMNPSRFGFKQKRPNILKENLPDSVYIKDASGQVVKRVLNFAAPDSLIIFDGQIQKICLEHITKHLTRPINIINENGEEPPGVLNKSIVSGDKDMIADKEKMGIKDWHIYMSEKKKHMRNLYSDQFMKGLPELKHTWFTLYSVEGGPIDRFDWSSSKATCSKIKGNYYSTPDFYPRWPNNWKTWTGAWHGWKWINDGRTVEIKDGDRFFSPFVAAGWAHDPETDIRPAQWLGLLKCLSVVGAEFYYTGYFNLKQPYSLPENYVWQAAMPAYAQAITSHFSDVFCKWI